MFLNINDEISLTRANKLAGGYCHLNKKTKKNQHLSIAYAANDGPSTSGFENVHLINDSVPELNIDDTDISTQF